MERKNTILNPNNAATVFNHGGTRAFMAKGDAHYLTTGSVEEVNSHAPAYANFLAANGAKHWAGELQDEPKGNQMMKNANEGLLTGKRLVQGNMTPFDPEKAAEMVKNAEKNPFQINMPPKAYVYS